eukprot:1528814-Karenia_brevis.AAC.1
MVATDCTSRKFEVQRGTRQGDPISPKIFNAVLEQAVNKVQHEWRRKGWGIKLGSRHEDILCNVRFADDILLLAPTKYQLQHMLQDLSKAVAEVGLEMHAGKTKIITNISDEGRRGERAVILQGKKIDILNYVDAVSYLGRSLSACDFHDVELQ